MSWYIDSPAPTHDDSAAIAVNRLADLLKRARDELRIAEAQWLAPSKDGLFRSRVSVLLDQIDAELPGWQISPSRPLPLEQE